MFPGDILDLIYNPETYGARFSFMLMNEDSLDDEEGK